jgi:hypothetical protein
MAERAGAKAAGCGRHALWQRIRRHRQHVAIAANSMTGRAEGFADAAGRAALQKPVPVR